MPTTATWIFGGVKLEPFRDPESAQLMNVKIPASTTIAKGTVLGEITASPGVFKAYNNANVDGSEVARAIMCYDVISDASGNITIGSQVGGGMFGETFPYCPVYRSGEFKTTDLTGLDAAGVTDLGRLVSGSVADGVLRIG